MPNQTNQRLSPIIFVGVVWCKFNPYVARRQGVDWHPPRVSTVSWRLPPLCPLRKSAAPRLILSLLANVIGRFIWRRSVRRTCAREVRNRRRSRQPLRQQPWQSLSALQLYSTYITRTRMGTPAHFFIFYIYFTPKEQMLSYFRLVRTNNLIYNIRQKWQMFILEINDIA